MIGEDQMAGVWANFARVSQSPFEFTIDFTRLDFSSAPPNGIVVARVSVSPLFITQLIDALQKQWKLYSDRAMPPEAQYDAEPRAKESDDPTSDDGPAAAGT
jgi:hypothetical protein